MEERKAQLSCPTQFNDHGSAGKTHADWFLICDGRSILVEQEIKAFQGRNWYRFLTAEPDIKNLCVRWNSEVLGIGVAN